MMRKITFFLLVGLLAGSPPGTRAQSPSRQTRYVPMDVWSRTFLFPKVRVNGFETTHASLGSKTSEGVSVYYDQPFGPDFLPGLDFTLYAQSAARQRFRFRSADTLGNQAACYVVAGLKLRAALANFPPNRSGPQPLRDQLIGWMLIQTAIDKDVWNLTLLNPNTTQGTYTEGWLESRNRSIRIAEITTPAEFARAGRWQEALLVSGIRKGYAFMYNNELIAALDFRPPPTFSLTRPEIVLWRDRNLDENLTFVLENLVSVLLMRQDLR